MARSIALYLKRNAGRAVRGRRIECLCLQECVRDAVELASVVGEELGYI
jgi:hypothetical protein